MQKKSPKNQSPKRKFRFRHPRGTEFPVPADAGLKVARTCLVTGEEGEKESLLRFVLGPERRLYFDAGARLPGRGAYVKASRTVLEKALADRTFIKKVAQNLLIPPTFPQEVEKVMIKHVLSLISFARKAGLVYAGFEKMKRALVKGQVVYACIAAGSEEKSSPFGSLLEGVPVYSILSREEMGSVFKKDAVVYLGFSQGDLTKKIRRELERLISFCEGIRGTFLDQEDSKELQKE